MNKYFRIFLAFASLSTKRYLEHRWNTFGNLSVSILSLAMMLAVVEVVFSHSPAINGWGKAEVFFLIGIYRIIMALILMLFLNGLSSISYCIQAGELDLLLVKPVNSQFFVTFRYARPFEFLDVLSGVYLVMYAYGNILANPTMSDALLLTLSLVLGTVTLYGIVFPIAALAIWFSRFHSLPSLYGILMKPISLPSDFFGARVSFVLTFIVPLGLVVTVPVKIFFGFAPYTFLFLEALFAAVLIYFSVWFWELSLKRYSSTGS